ncbi:MAG: hypothetical protein AAFU54_23605 [Chloroflexota bacterium]
MNSVNRFKTQGKFQRDHFGFSSARFPVGNLTLTLLFAMLIVLAGEITFQIEVACRFYFALAFGNGDLLLLFEINRPGTGKLVLCCLHAKLRHQINLLCFNGEQSQQA